MSVLRSIRLSLLCLRLGLFFSMWKDLPEPLGPMQKKFALSVNFTFPSLPVMSMHTGSPWRSV